MSIVLGSEPNPAACGVCSVVRPKLIPAAAELYQEFGHCHGKNVYGDETRGGECRIRRTEANGRHGLAWLHPFRDPGVQGVYVGGTAGGDEKGVGAYGRSSRISGSNGTALQQLAGDNWLVLMVSRRFFCVPEGGM